MSDAWTTIRSLAVHIQKLEVKLESMKRKIGLP